MDKEKPVASSSSHIPLENMVTWICAKDAQTIIIIPAASKCVWMRFLTHLSNDPKEKHTLKKQVPFGVTSPDIITIHPWNMM